MKNTTFLIQNRQQHKKTKDLSILQLYENKIKPSEREIWLEKCTSNLFFAILLISLALSLLNESTTTTTIIANQNILKSI